VARKANLHICSNTIVSRLNVSPGNGNKPRVKGAFFESVKGGQTFSAFARKEVILCAGAIKNPQILMLSGIGPKTHLEQFNIKVVKDMPGVGSHLGDHTGIPMSWEVPIDDSMHILYNRPMQVLWNLIKYITIGKGIFSVPFLQSAIFVRTSLLNDQLEPVIGDKCQLDVRLTENIPDVEIMPSHHRANPSASDPVLDKIGVFTFMPTLIQPKSRGSVRLRSSKPTQPPVVELGFLTHPDDIITFRKAVRLTFKLADQMTKEGYLLKPIASQLPASESDDDIDDYIKKTIRSCLHYMSSCRMAPEDDPLQPGVVDDQLRVYGVDGLRIADTSIFPDSVATPTMAPAVVVAEKCAQMIQREAAATAAVH